MAFSFGFSGDDIDIDETENDHGVPQNLVPGGASHALPALVKASHHDMNEWVRSSAKARISKPSI